MGCGFGLDIINSSTAASPARYLQLLSDTVKQFIIFFIATLLFGCISYERKQDVLKTDKDFTEFWRLTSPDSSMILLNYGINHGAFGYGHAGTAVLKLADTTKNLRQYTIAYNLDRFKWLDSKTVSAKFDIIPFLRCRCSNNHKAIAPASKLRCRCFHLHHQIE